MSKVAVWAGVIVIAAAVGSTLDGTSTDTTIPSAPVVTQLTSTTSTVVDTSLPSPDTLPGDALTDASGSSGSSKKTPKTTAAVEDDEVDCNNWEDYVDSGEYDEEDIADICGLDDSEIDDYENG